MQTSTKHKILRIATAAVALAGALGSTLLTPAQREMALQLLANLLLG